VSTQAHSWGRPENTRQPKEDKLVVVEGGHEEIATGNLIVSEVRAASPLVSTPTHGMVLYRSENFTFVAFLERNATTPAEEKRQTDLQRDRAVVCMKFT
jgi:hypothetical protein